jgi:hypothetical protein
MGIADARESAPEPVEQVVPLWTPRRAAWWQASAIAILTVLSVAEQYVIHILDRADLEDYLITFDLDAESNLPTWYSSAMLFACAVLLARIAAVTRREGGRFAGHWRALSIVFAFLSLDEIARIHEHLGRLHEAWHTHGLFYFAWVIPGAIAVLVFAAIFARFVFHLPAPIRWRFVAAGAVFVGGALVVEALGGWRAETMGMNNMTHSLIATVEEVMELTGVAWFLVTLLRHLGDPGRRGAARAASADVAAGPVSAAGTTGGRPTDRSRSAA